MSTTINTGGPAFPCDNILQRDERGHFFGNEVSSTGMTLRDHFAGQALQGLCANPGGPYQANGMNGWSIVNCTYDDLAGHVYELADAMLRAREGGAA